MKAEGDAYRLKEVHRWTMTDGTEKERVIYHGPWNSKTTTKGQKTRLERQNKRYGTYGIKTYTVEKSETKWIEVTDDEQS